MLKFIKRLFLTIFIVAVVFVAWVWLTTMHPSDVQKEEVMCSAQAPILKSGQKLKVLSWNVQYMAGKNYVFFYDVLDGSGPDIRPSSKDIAVTFNEVTRVIQDEKPDVILLQELDNNAKRTDYENQLKKLLTKIDKSYACNSSTYYWKASFVPHPKILGSVGMKLATISKYKIDGATRYQLPLKDNDLITRQMDFHRAILEVRLPYQDEQNKVVGHLSVLNTHFDAFAQGQNTMELQVRKAKEVITQLEKKKYVWILGGDFNLLASQEAYNRLTESGKKYYNPKGVEMSILTKDYKFIPTLEDINGEDYKKWNTHFPNDPQEKGNERTIDYLFYSNHLKMENYSVRQNDTKKISDHLPVIAEVVLP